MFAAVLDSCVLWPSLQRDFLLSLAIEGIYRPLWSERIFEEVEYNEEQKLIGRGAPPKEARERARHLIEQMRTAFDDSCVTGWEPLDGTYGLPDPDDEHVVAAAHMGGAGAIVTDNVRDFPHDRLPSAIDIQTPTTFAAHTIQVDPIAATRAVYKLANRSGRQGPALTPGQVLDLLDLRYEMHDATRRLRVLIAEE